MPQKQLEWFNEDCLEFAPSHELRKEWVDPDNPNSPFYSFIGNRSAVERLCCLAFTAFSRYNRCCSDLSFALLGPASVGKTTLARKFAELMQLPFIEIDPRSISKLDDFVNQIALVLQKTIIKNWDDSESTLELEPESDGSFILPPCIIFIDEAQSLRKNIVEGLKKATEKNDGLMTVEHGYNIDFGNVCWLLATNKWGLLDPALQTRFSELQLNNYSLDEISQIVQVRYPEWDEEVCDLVAKYSEYIPRVALSIAVEAKLAYDMNPDSWEDVIERLARKRGIDKYGMSEKRLAVLKTLGQGAKSKLRLASAIQCGVDELENTIIPPLMMVTPDRDPLVTTGQGKGYCITEQGIEELNRRNIKHIYDNHDQTKRFSLN